MHLHFHARCSQGLYASATDQWVGVQAGHFHARHAGLNQGPAARGCAPVMAARLQAHPGRGAAQVQATLCGLHQCVGLGVKAARCMGVAFNPLPRARHDDATHARVGVAQPDGLFGQFQAAPCLGAHG